MFQKGNPGKRPGTKGRSRVLVEQTAKRLGIDPFEILCLAAKGDFKSLGTTKKSLTLDIRISCAKEACAYLNAKLRSVELKNPDGTGFRVEVVDYTTVKK